MNADAVLSCLQQRGFGLFSGVPCSYLTPLINAAIDSSTIRYVNAANEGEAVAICSGAELGGVRALAMFQNSGLGNAVSPLTSLNAIFRIPVLLVCTWRGQVGGKADEPQHDLMGRSMANLIENMEIPAAVFPQEEGELQAVLARATKSMDDSGLPFALLLPEGVIDSRKLETTPPPRRTRNTRLADLPKNILDVDACLATIGNQAANHQAAVLATTGFTGRALYAHGDRENQFYMVGSMGCVSSLALGLALVHSQKQVIAIDGDGALLMRMSGLAAVAAAAPANLTHVVLDNGVHDSTGAQATLSHMVDIPAVAAACGYPSVATADSIEQLAQLLSQPQSELRMIYLRTSPRTDRNLPRPTITPPMVAQRLRNWLRQS